MKRILVTLIAIVACVGAMSARDRYTRDVNVLPPQARTCLVQHFNGIKVDHIKVDKEIIGGTTYDVVLTDGTELEFDSNGVFKEIERGNKAVPESLILPSISKFVKANYKGRKIVQLKVSNNKYEIELNDGRELEFDRSGKFLRIDN